LNLRKFSLRKLCEMLDRIKEWKKRHKKALTRLSILAMFIVLILLIIAQTIFWK